jgi:hypothetical protein
LAEGDHRRVVVHIQRHVLAEAERARVARRDVKPVEQRRACYLPGQRVFTPAPAE